LRLDRANLEGVHLVDNNLSGFNLLFANLRDAKLRDANFALANLAFADLGRADLKDADLRDADLVLANLTGTNLTGANLSGADLRFASLEETNFSGADLSGADLSGADLEHANLSRPNLTGASTNLTGANLTGANLDGADLYGANLSGADLSSADLETAMNLTPTQIDRTVAGDKATIVPEDIREPSRWSTSKDSVMWPSTDSRLKASLVAIRSLNEEDRDKFGMPEEVDTSGVLVTTVTPGGLAASAGFKAGDVITSVGKRRVRGREDLQHELERYEVGNRVWFVMWRSYFQGWKKGTLDTWFGDEEAAN
jgi:Pentapeptide repeats (8 copies)/PDZ domain